MHHHFRLKCFSIISIFIATLIFNSIGFAGDGFLYIYDSTAVTSTSDVDSCFRYAENTIRPALDRWLSYYADFSTGNGDTLTIADLCRYDGIIIAPFLDSLASLPNFTGLPDWLQNNIARAVNDSGVGLFNCDPYIWGLTDSMKAILPVYYPSSPLMTNSAQNIPYIRNSSQLGNFINELGYPGESFIMYDVDSVTERYIKIDSLGDNLTPIIQRGAAPYYPIIAAGWSPSGKAHIWTLLSPPDWWSSPLDSTANGWARHGSMSDIFWRGLAYVAKGGVALKVLNRYASFNWLDEPPNEVGDFEFIDKSLSESILGRNIPVNFQIHTYNLSNADVNYLNHLQQRNNCRFILHSGGDGFAEGFWAQKVDSVGGMEYFRSLSKNEFESVLDSVENLTGRTAIEFQPIFSAHQDVWDLGLPGDGQPIRRWLSQRGLNEVAISTHPLFTIGADSISYTNYQNAARSRWYPKPFGSYYWFEDYLDTSFNGMFSYLSANQSIVQNDYDWMKRDVSDSLLNQALANFKESIAGALEGGIPAYIELHPNMAADICTTGVSPLTNPPLTISTRWDSLAGLIDDYASSKGIKWIHTYDAYQMVRNLGNVTIASCLRNGNTFDIALAGATDFETEITVFYGINNNEMPIKIPPFDGNLFLTVKIYEGREGYYAEIY